MNFTVETDEAQSSWLIKPKKQHETTMSELIWCYSFQAFCNKLNQEKKKKISFSYSKKHSLIYGRKKKG